MQAGLKEQLAAELVQTEGAKLQIHGTPGDWSVAVTYQDRDALWLSTSRRPSLPRSFATLDTAHAAAIDIARTADPATEINHVTIPVTMTADQ